jgi:hypothetical protein
MVLTRLRAVKRGQTIQKANKSGGLYFLHLLTAMSKCTAPGIRGDEGGSHLGVETKLALKDTITGVQSRSDSKWY